MERSSELERRASCEGRSEHTIAREDGPRTSTVAAWPLTLRSPTFATPLPVTVIRFVVTPDKHFRTN